MSLNEDLRLARSQIEGLSNLLEAVIERLEKCQDQINQQYQEIVALTNQRDKAQVMVHKYAKKIEELTS